MVRDHRRAYGATMLRPVLVPAKCQGYWFSYSVGTGRSGNRSELTDDPELDDIDEMLRDYDRRQEELLRQGLLDHGRHRVQGGDRVSVNVPPPSTSPSRRLSSPFCRPEDASNPRQQAD